MFKDYYAILEISNVASLIEIKSAYKIQAKKWHPDRNKGADTTERMKEINEAKLILTDSEARERYDIEFIKFMRHREATEDSRFRDKGKREENQNAYKNTKRENWKGYTESVNDDYISYKFDDEVLKRWMENAGRQALRNLNEMINEFGTATITGFGEFFKLAFMAILLSFVYFIISLIFRL
jgi:curved DNA-binding protein CbpA